MTPTKVEFSSMAKLEAKLSSGASLIGLIVMLTAAARNLTALSNLISNAITAVIVKLRLIHKCSVVYCDSAVAWLRGYSKSNFISCKIRVVVEHIESALVVFIDANSIINGCDI